MDMENIPLWNGKPITEIDIDADLAEQAKPWRRPGADQSVCLFNLVQNFLRVDIVLPTTCQAYLNLVSY
jgi:hypothetical protein